MRIAQIDGKHVPQPRRAINAQQAEFFRAQIATGIFNLLPDEIWWRDRNQILEDHGYRLRSRLQPGWIPPWQDSDTVPHSYEDSLRRCRQKVVDAVRKSDGKDVAIMNIPRTSHEGEIFKHLSDSKRAGVKYRHVVPLLDTFEDEREPDLEFFVMPLLRQFDRPPFSAVSEVVNMFQQLLEGLVYMHSVGVAHRDCSLGNIMMDAPSVFPNGFHPCDITRDRGGIQKIKIIPRYRAPGPVRYYFIDFGISRLYEPDEEHLVVGDDGADREIPEMSDDDEYDPFPADVFILGNIFKKFFLSKYGNVGFLSPLVDAMTATEPSQRPSAADAQKRLRSIISSHSYFSLRHRLVTKEQTKDFKSAMLENVGILVDAALCPVKVAIGIPSQTISAVRGLMVSNFSKKTT